MVIANLQTSNLANLGGVFNWPSNRLDRSPNP